VTLDKEEAGWKQEEEDALEGKPPEDESPAKEEPPWF